MPAIAKQLAENVAQIRGRIAAAAQRSGRTADGVALVAVTKFIPANVVRELVGVGCRDLGESRPQELWQKAAALADLPIRWHLIGHLQRNKVRRTLPLVSMIHSIDGPRLCAAVDEEAGLMSATANAQRRADIPVCRTAASFAAKLPVLLEVNVSGEQSKHGFTPEDVERFLPDVPGYQNVSVCGLMCMAALEGGPDVARRDFAALRDLGDRLRRNCPPGVTLDELSMGMSGDFEIAIDEGATMVRVGSALFEGIS